MYSRVWKWQYQYLQRTAKEDYGFDVVDVPHLAFEQNVARSLAAPPV